MISGAASDGFEWFHGMRFVAGMAALVYFRAEFRSLNWRVSWFAPVAGALVFVLWIAFDRLQDSNNADHALAASLAGMSTTADYSWIVFRVAAATITAPLVEELAFRGFALRGFALRRLTATGFETIAFHCVTPFAILASSLLFGCLHGDRWLPAALAGAVYALCLRARGRMGDAVAAHAATNAALAAWVMARGAWHLW